MLETDELLDLLEKLDVLEDRLLRERQIRCGRSGTEKDIDYVASRMGVANLFEFGPVLITMLGPVITPFPVLCFDERLGRNSPYYFERSLDLYPEWIQLGWLPIASDGCGGYFVYPTSSERHAPRPIFLVRPDESSIDPQCFVASHVVFFLIRLFESELNGEEDDPFLPEIIQATDPAAEQVAKRYQELSQYRSHYSS